MFEAKKQLMNRKHHFVALELDVMMIRLRWKIILFGGFSSVKHQKVTE